MGTTAFAYTGVPAGPPTPCATLHNGPEAAMIRRILQGSREEFGDLLQPHLHALIRLVRARMKNDTDADDVVQDTIIRALRHLDQFRYEANFRTWLNTIAINEVLQRQRSPKYSRTILVDGQLLANLELADPRLSPLAEYERTETSLRLREALDRLPAKYRTVIELRDLGGRSLAETARCLRLTVSAVKSRQHRGRLLLLDSLRRIQRRPAGARRRRGSANARA